MPVRRRQSGRWRRASSGATRRMTGTDRLRSVREAACKPSSVPPRRGGDGHPSGTPVARRLVRPTRGRSDAAPGWDPVSGSALPSYLALLQVELARFTRPDDRRRPSAGSSLWRWSSPLGGRVLPATLRRGARTFLEPSFGFPRRGPRPSGRLADDEILWPWARAAPSDAPGTAPRIVRPSARRRSR